MKIIQLAIRTLLRFRLYTAINILGLALSLACCLIISRYVYQELTVNHFNKNLDRIYLTAMQKEGEHGFSPYGVENRNEEPAFVDPLQSPLIEKSTSFFDFADDDISIDQQKFNAHIYVTDTNFLKILDYPLIQGFREKVLSDPKNAVITQAFAKKIFGKQDPMGKTLMHSSGKLLTITGVVGEASSKSSFKFDLIISASLQKHWSRVSYTLAQLATNADIDKLNKQNEPFMEMKAWGYKIRYQFFPLKEFYFNKELSFYENPDAQGNYTNVIVLVIVAGLILLVGVFNFINIYTVLMLKRAREFGLKKVFGSNSGYIIGQLFAENLVMIGIALCISWALIEISKGLIEKELEIPQLAHPQFDCLLSIAILIVIPFVTSIYPFIRYNYAMPISSLKSVNVGGNSVVSRTIFLLLQYIITFCLVVIAIFFMKQLNFMLNTDLGYRTENIIKVQFHRFKSSYDITSDEDWKAQRAKVESQKEEIKQKMNESPLFISWDYGDSPHEFMSSSVKFKTPDGDFKELSYATLSDKYFKIYDFKLKEGRRWNDSTEQWVEYNLIINETAQKIFGITSIDNTLLQPESRLWWSSEIDRKDNPPYRIVGVIKDFKGEHLSQKTRPLAIAFSEGWTENKLTAAIAKGKKQEAIAFLKKLHNDTVGGEFEYSFVEDEVNELYRQDKRITNIYSIFAIIAIFISSLGLFGLSLFDVQQRYREIALRKVNGAQIKDVLLLLLRKYYLLLAFSFIIAIPLSYFAIHKYMENFAYKTPVSWWIFAIAATVTTAISLGTLIFHMRKAANTNPAIILKSE